MSTPICEDCLPPCDHVMVYTHPAILPCAACGRMEDRRGGGPIIHNYPTAYAEAKLDSLKNTLSIRE